MKVKYNFLFVVSALTVTWIQRQGAAGAADLHRYRRRAHPQTSRLLPSSPHHRQDGHHHQLREDRQWHQSPWDPAGAKEQHESNVRAVTDNKQQQLNVVLSSLSFHICVSLESTAPGSSSSEMRTSSWGRVRRTWAGKTPGFALCSVSTYLSLVDSTSLSKQLPIPLSAVRNVHPLSTAYSFSLRSQGGGGGVVNPVQSDSPFTLTFTPRVILEQWFSSLGSWTHLGSHLILNGVVWNSILKNYY